MSRPPLPPFTLETTIQKVRLAELERKSRWPAIRRSDGHAGLTELGL